MDREATLWPQLASLANAAGLNVQVAVGRADVEAAFDAVRQRGAAPRIVGPADLAPHYRAAIVLGSAGRDLWRRLLAAEPAFSAASDPLDRLTERVVGPLLDTLRATDPNAESAFPFRHPRQLVPFQALTQHLPWAKLTPLGILVHPRVGPWFAWRGVLLTSLQPPPSLEEKREGPCATCPAPCVSACPAQAVDKAGFRWEDCANHRLGAESCQETCLARQACPVGLEFRYGADQLAYHYGASLRMIRRRAAAADTD